MWGRNKNIDKQTAKKIWEQYLRLHSLKPTKRRQLILDTLLDQPNQMTMDEICKSVRRAVPCIGLGTVYRNVELLCECGIVGRFKNGRGADRFEAAKALCWRFVCVSCGNIVDIAQDSANADDIAAQFSSCRGDQSRNTIYYTYLTHYGLCEHCMKMNEHDGSFRKGATGISCSPATGDEQERLGNCVE